MTEQLEHAAPVGDGARALRNFGFLTLGKVAGDLFTFALFVALSRYYGQEGLGQYSLGMALAGFFGMVADFGLFNLSVKRMSRRGEDFIECFSELWTVRLLLVVAALAILLGVLPWLPFERDTRLVIALVGGYQILYTMQNGLIAIFVAREKMHLAALLEFALKMGIALSGIAIAMSGGALTWALVSFPLVAFTLLLIIYGWIVRDYGRVRLHFSGEFVRRTLREAVPYGSAELLRQLATRIDVLFLGYMLGTAAAGLYNAAYRITFVLMMLAYFASVALFPQAARLYAGNRDELIRLYRQSLRAIILISVPASAGLWLIAPEVVEVIFGPDFSESSTVLRYLACLLFLSFLHHFLGLLLTACDRQVLSTQSQWRAAWVNIMGNLVLIPWLGITGAAIASVVSEGVLVALLFVHVKALLGWPQVGARVLISLLGVGAFYLPFMLVPGVSIAIEIPAAIMIYLLALMCFRETRENELRMLIGLVQRRISC